MPEDLVLNVPDNGFTIVFTRVAVEDRPVGIWEGGMYNAVQIFKMKSPGSQVIFE